MIATAIACLASLLGLWILLRRRRPAAPAGNAREGRVVPHGTPIREALRGEPWPPDLPPRPLKEALRESALRLEEALDRSENLPGLRTGLGSLDHLLGGLRPGRLYLLAGRRGAGKTSLALQIIHHAACAEETPVLFFSLEHSAAEAGLRMISARAEVDRRWSVQGRITDAEYMDLLLACGGLHEAPILVDEAPRLAPREVRMRALLARAGGGLGLVVVDSLERLDGDDPVGAAASLRALARELDVPVLALSEGRRAPEAFIAAPPAVGEFPAAPEADAVLLLDRVDQAARVAVAKNPGEPTGSCGLTFLAGPGRFKDPG